MKEPSGVYWILEIPYFRMNITINQETDNKKQTIIKPTQIKINIKINNQHNKLQSQQSNQ
jgi:hypothetical protein